MTHKYEISISTPAWDCEVSANSLDELANVIPKRMANVLNFLAEPDPDFALDHKARMLLDAHRNNRGHWQESRIGKAG